MHVWAGLTALRCQNKGKNCVNVIGAPETGGRGEGEGYVLNVTLKPDPTSKSLDSEQLLKIQFATRRGKDCVYVCMFLCRRFLGVLYCGIKRCVVPSESTDVSEQRVATIFMVEV
jgi:hypothetical protein